MRLRFSVSAAMLFVCVFAFGTCAFAQTYQAYQASGTGNQAYGGALGLDFNVNAPIVITHLGVWDSDQNGLAVPITAQLWNRAATGSPVASTLFAAGSTGTLTAGHRFLQLTTPITLNTGFQGTIAAGGYGATEFNGNVGAGAPPRSTDNGGGLITFVGGGRYDAGGNPIAFPGTPDGGPANRYTAGSFLFRAAVANLNVTTTDNPSGFAAPGPGTLDYGATRIGTTTNKSLAARHSGDQFTTLSGTVGATSGPRFISGAAINYSLATGASSAAQNIAYTPNAHVANTDSVLVTSNVGNVTMNISGRGVGPEFQAKLDPTGANSTLSANPGGSVINAGTTSLVNGPSVTQSEVIRIANVSPDLAGPGFDPATSSLENMTVAALISGADAAQFSIFQTPDDGVTLLPFTGVELSQNEFIDLVVQFNGAESFGFGDKAALLTINTDVNSSLGNTAGGASFSFNLAATATPEPGTIVLWTIVGVVGVCLGARRCRRAAG